MRDDYLYRCVSALKRRVFRLGLATNYGVEGVDLEWALEQGVNYLFWTPTARKVTSSLKAALRRDRESLVLATGPNPQSGWSRARCQAPTITLGLPP